jgi:hypothetical protein
LTIRESDSKHHGSGLISLREKLTFVINIRYKNVLLCIMVACKDNICFWLVSGKRGNMFWKLYNFIYTCLHEVEINILNINRLATITLLKQLREYTTITEQNCNNYFKDVNRSETSNLCAGEKRSASRSIFPFQNLNQSIFV